VIIGKDEGSWGADLTPRMRRSSRLLSVPERELVLARWLARTMDGRWHLGPFRFGLESVLRFVPIVGGTSSLALSLYQVVLALRLRLPSRTLIRMAGNIAVDLTLGLIPYLGDLADAWFRVHLRNQRLIDRYVAPPVSKHPEDSAAAPEVWSA
jgi:hypothetical protein